MWILPGRPSETPGIDWPSAGHHFSPLPAGALLAGTEGKAQVKDRDWRRGRNVRPQVIRGPGCPRTWPRIRPQSRAGSAAILGLADDGRGVSHGCAPQRSSAPVGGRSHPRPGPPRSAAARSAVRSLPAFAISISAGEVITWSPPTCLTGKCPSGMPFTTMIGDQGRASRPCQFRCHRYLGHMSLRPTAWYGALFSTARPWLHQGPAAGRHGPQCAG